ncbi:MAG: hypothetical protein KGL39_09980 [Patescibacteria group bacterium]|nr:hypothetical protein [Patescibacteria group bacterium]
MSEQLELDLEPQGSGEGVSPEVLREAELQGWVPKELFRGDDSDWIDAETFVRRGKEINPILKKNNEVLLRKIEAKDSELAEIREAVAEFKKFHADTEKRAYQKALADLKAEKKEALAEGDHERVVEIDDEILDLKDKQRSPEVKKPSPPNPKDDPVYRAWEDANPWSREDAMSQAAVRAAELLRIQGRQETGRIFLDLVAEKVKEAFPEKFNNQNRNRASAVEGGTPAAHRPGGKTYADLPTEAKAACDKFVKQGLLSREEYVREYDWAA